MNTGLGGPLRMLAASYATPIEYTLCAGGGKLALNPRLGQTIRISASGRIHCIACDALTRRSYGQGHCYRCFRRLARCDLCMVRPELCHHAAGTCREPDWGEAFCMRPHIVYLANSSGLKVGITRATHTPGRWIDQGATQALAMLGVASRHQAGLIERLLAREVSDRTDWRAMLRADPPVIDLRACAERLLEHARADIEQVDRALGAPARRLGPDGAAPLSLRYPVREYPRRIVSLSLEKQPRVEGVLLGVKGQYLILDRGVLNVRRHAGYEVRVEV